VGERERERAIDNRR
jgi:hypothetical protein